MSDFVETVKIKPSHPSQGEYVLINKSNFDEKQHEEFDPDGATKKALTVDEIKAALAEKQVAIPDGVTKKADLQALLDAAPAE